MFPRKLYFLGKNLAFSRENADFGRKYGQSPFCLFKTYVSIQNTTTCEEATPLRTQAASYHAFSDVRRSLETGETPHFLLTLLARDALFDALEPEDGRHGSEQH